MNPHRRVSLLTPHASSSWQAADDLVRTAKLDDSSAVGALAELLGLSNQIFDPLADPLGTDFGTHRWLTSEREEAYSDWFGWILEQIGDAGQVLRLLGVPDRKLLRLCASEKPLINREVRIPNGRPDLVVEFGSCLVVIVEIKTKPFDQVAVKDQLTRYSRWVPDPRNPPLLTLRYFVAVEFREFDCPSTFELLPWRELTLRMREQALEWIRASKRQEHDRSDLVRAAMTVAFCGAVEQNLLGLSGKPMIFRTRSSAQYLKEWSARR